MRAMPIGLPAPFDPTIAARACELANDGKLMPAIAEELGLSVTTLNKWRQLHPVFSQAFDNARDQGLDVLVDQLPDIAVSEDYDHHTARLLSENIKWIAERRARRRYGAQLDLNITERVDLTGALLEARKRTLQPNSNPALPNNTQAIEYTDYNVVTATDNESAVLPDGMPNPFD